VLPVGVVLVLVVGFGAELVVVGGALVVVAVGAIGLVGSSGVQATRATRRGTRRASLAGRRMGGRWNMVVGKPGWVRVESTRARAATGASRCPGARPTVA